MEKYLRQPVLTLSVSEVQVLLLARTKGLFLYPLCGSTILPIQRADVQVQPLWPK
jgi:hypothetical protein